VSRIVSGDNAAEAAKVSVAMVVLAELDFSSGIVRVHDGVGDLTFSALLRMEDGDNLQTEASENIALEGSSETFLGIGQFGGIDLVDESIEVIARSITLTLSGVDSSLVATTMTENYQNRDVTIYLGFLNSTDRTLIDTPEVVWEGRMNQMSLNIAKGVADIKLTCEYRLRREPRIARFTNEDQQTIFPNDQFFDLTYAIPGFVSQWGNRDATYGGRLPGSDGSGRGTGGKPAKK
jgi:hypothetical protein